MTAAATDDVGGSGGPRSAATRQAILAAARSEFSAHGFHGATVRGIAASAGIDPSMVMRYFGSKAALFAVATKVVLEPIDLASVPARKRGEALIGYLVGRWEDDAAYDTLAMLRTAVTDANVATAMQEVFNHVFREPMAAIGGDRLEERTAAVGAIVLGLAVTRYVLRLEPVASLTVDAVVDTFARALQPLLTPPRKARRNS